MHFRTGLGCKEQGAGKYLLIVSVRATPLLPVPMHGANVHTPHAPLLVKRTVATSWVHQPSLAAFPIRFKTVQTS